MKKIIHILVFVCLYLSPCQAQSYNDLNILKSYIDDNMNKTIRICNNDTLGNFSLPFPFSVPCIEKGFQNLFYWDTYFTNVGLLTDGEVQQAKNNVDNILYMIERFGYMPNATCESMLNRSQPPYASMMVKEVYEKTKDREWLSYACNVLEKEYEFWMTQRITPTGLNCYSNNATHDDLMSFYQYMSRRLGLNPDDYKTDDEKLKQASHFLAEAESGWDFNPRFDSRCEDFNPIDLNANLYAYEKNFIYFYDELNHKGGREWCKRALKRKKLMNKYCLNPQDKLYYDYDFINDKRSTIYSAAIFNTLFVELADKNTANSIYSNLDRLECMHGLAACEKGHHERTYQWDYPNGWSALIYLAIKGFDNYGYQSAARQIAHKYINSLANIYIKTGNLWEKYNAETGDIDVKNEYAMPGAFMGWTAGVYLYAFDYCYKIR